MMMKNYFWYLKLNYNYGNDLKITSKVLIMIFF